MNRDSIGLLPIILVVFGVGLRRVEAGAVEAVGAEALLGKADAFHQGLELAELQRGEAELVGYLFNHLTIAA